MERLEKEPDLIITNHRPSDKREINKNLPFYSEVSNKPKLNELEFMCGLFEDPIITRIINGI